MASANTSRSTSESPTKSPLSDAIFLASCLMSNVEMKKKTVPTNELPENVLKYVNNYKVQFIDSRTEMTKSDWAKEGQVYSEKGMHPLQKFPEFQARDKDRMSVAANVSIANLEDDLKDDILY